MKSQQATILILTGCYLSTIIEVVVSVWLDICYAPINNNFCSENL